MADERRPSDADSDLWRAVTADVKPIARESAPPAGKEPAKPGSGDKPAAREKARPAVQIRPAAPPPKPAQPALAHGAAAGLDRRSLERLRRGRMEIEAELDLHGHTRAEAHRELAAFIEGQAGAGRRCVIVITGKGSTREGGGVLKSAVPDWLNEPELREHVLAFSHARPNDGGEGALYVLLRRKRPRAVRKK